MGLGNRAIRIFWLAVMTAHATIAALWWWQRPGGFPIWHGRFWLHSVFPWVMVWAMLAARFARGRTADSIQRYITGGLSIMWIAGAIAARLVFPVTFHWLWLGPLLIGIVMMSIWVLQFGRESVRQLLIAGIAAVFVGVGAQFVEHAPAPDSRPLNVSFPPISEMTSPSAFSNSIALSDSIEIRPIRPLVSWRSGSYQIAMNPLLTFDSRSPDGCWTVLAKDADQDSPPRKLLTHQLFEKVLQLSYSDDDHSILTVDASNPDATRIEAISKLPAVVWSHLNTFAFLRVLGHKRLYVSFSPCPENRIEFEPMDYPTGRPERFAFLDDAGIFHVVQAADAEKGPFMQLASGPLSRSDSLTMTFYDDDFPFCRVVMDDFAAQASTQLSPTAGWRVPANSIEFSLEADNPESSGGIYISLAATSVGRGYDSVGHSAGTYRNRMRIENLLPTIAPPATNPNE